MTWSEDELLEAFRHDRGPDAAARARLEARRPDLPAATDIRPISAAPTAGSPWVRRGVVAAVALAAAVAATCALRPQTASELERDVPGLVPDAAESAGHVTGRAVPLQPAGRGGLAFPSAPRPTPEPGVATPDAPTLAEPAPAPHRAPPARASSRPTAGERVPGAVDPVTPTTPGPTTRPTTIAAEAAAIGAARKALNEGDAQTALERIADYKKRFSQPVLAEEAAAVAAMAACHGASSTAAAASTRAFAKAHPGSLFHKQVQRSCTPAHDETSAKKDTPMQRPRRDADIQE